MAFLFVLMKKDEDEGSSYYLLFANIFCQSMIISVCPKSIFFNVGNSFNLFTDVKICEKAISH